MKILMLNWRDLKNPKSGGAEVLTEGILAKLSKRHDITLFSASFSGAKPEEIVNGYRIIRAGNPFTVHLMSFIWWHRKFKKEGYEVVIDQIHGIPFFTPLYIRGPRLFAFIHEVARDIWKQMYGFPLGHLGFLLEPLFFRPYRKTPFITVSDSTKSDLISLGITEENVQITQEAIDDEMFEGVPDLPKESEPTLISLGRLAKMKRVDHVIEAFRHARESIPNLKLWVVGAGDEAYTSYLKKLSQDLPVTFFGRVDLQKKRELLKKSWLLVSCSLKEGFGLVVIEAGVYGVPSIVYNVHGFRDSVKHEKTGIVTPQSPESMAEEIADLVRNGSAYSKLSANVLEYVKSFTFDKASDNFEQLIMHHR